MFLMRTFPRCEGSSLNTIRRHGSFCKTNDLRGKAVQTRPIWNIVLPHVAERMTYSHCNKRIVELAALAQLRTGNVSHSEGPHDRFDVYDND